MSTMITVSPATVGTMVGPYAGPLRDEPLPVELHNTLWAIRGRSVDGLADAAGLRAWLAALGPRLPVKPGSAGGDRLEDFLTLRGAVRDALRAAATGRRPAAATVQILNEAS